MSVICADLSAQCWPLTWFIKTTSGSIARSEIVDSAQKVIPGIDTIMLDEECRVQEERQFAAVSATVKIEDLLKPGASNLVQQVQEKLQQDVDDAQDEDDVAPDAQAVATCMRLARRLAPHVALAPRLEWGAFTEDNRGVSLVLQSLVTDRRINCRIQSGGSAISAVRVDEHMRVDTIPVLLSAPDVGRELAEWVTRRV